METTNERIDPETGFRYGTLNLIISGLENELDNMEITLKTGNLPFIRIKETKKYEDLQSIINKTKRPGLGELNIYLVHVDDIIGAELVSLKEKIKPFLEPFDSVEGIYWIGGESDGCVGVQTIKDHGRYDDFYDSD